eukprot:CAMPEP_0195516822 /NCGR_PEP_ID=MMETSP0794_2-20130614/8844_1 /TAXON_ID=515487 /ORGANISM="Stephanopyxis turris, Strain CCMP 815" /LENGTH=386 /DNA_ID=CAMNT_0040645519 /DNA_START=63 /DNA_END=1223 /DNA_ORIENTATION=+
MGRALSRRANTWETLAKVMPASKQGDFSATIAAFKKRQEKAASASLDADIDFEAYKKILGAKEVNAIKKEYEAFSYTDFESDKKAELAALQEALDQTVAAIYEQSANLTAAAAEASVELAELERTRTTLETTLSDVIRRNPELHAELEARIANEDWDTDSKPIDVNALRLEAIEKNWDASTLGTLDENAQKEFLDEIESLEQQSASSADAEVPEHIVNYISEWHSLLGRTEDFAGLRQFAAANTVTDADREITNERELWSAIDMATELCMFDRAKGLIEHAEALKASGDLVVDEAWRDAETKRMTTARHHQDYNSPVAPEDLEGKSAEELADLATEAAGRSDFYRASHYMYASRVKSGDINPDDKDLRSFSGFANHFHNVSMGMAQ